MWQWIKERLLQRSRKEQIDIAYERNRAAYNEEIRQRSLRAQIALDFNEAIGKPGQRAEIILFASMGGDADLRDRMVTAKSQGGSNRLQR